MDSIYFNNHIYIKILELIRGKQPCILATVTETFGSAPQKAASSAIVNRAGLIAGTVGGGVVEQQILDKATSAVVSKRSCYCRFDLKNDITDEEAGICGGDMNILFDASPEKHLAVFSQLKESIENRISGVLVSICESGQNGDLDIQRLWITQKNLPKFSKQLNDDVFSGLGEMIQKPVQGEFRKFVKHTSPKYEDNYIFLESIIPKSRLIIAGAGHVGKALSHYGKLLDFEVTVWDNREDHASKNNLPDADFILNDELEKSLGSVKVDRNTFIVIVTHGHKNDADVLKLFIDSSAGYIGMIGSKRKVAQVREKFIKNRWGTVEKWNEIHAPIGLDVHAGTVQEIALSIAAQLVKIRFEMNLNHG